MSDILLVIGSLRDGGFNQQLADEISQAIGSRATVNVLDYSDVPLFNQDDSHQPAVTRVREQVSNADGVWVVTPEYNGSYPGVLKNLFDWLSISLDPKDSRGKSAIHGKKTTVSGIGGGEAKGARFHTEEMLKFIRTDVLTTEGYGVTPTRDEWHSGQIDFSDDTRKDGIRNQADAFLSHIGAR